MNSDLIINIKNKTFKDEGSSFSHNAIKDLYLKIPNGEFCCLIGPSGCGKTTLLNIVAGLDSSKGSKVFLIIKNIIQILRYPICFKLLGCCHGLM